jgi:hypothetical protein
MKYLFSLLSFALACASPTKEPAPSHNSNDGHLHRAPHGGLVQNAGDKHLELLLHPDGHLDVYLLDTGARALSTQKASGRVKLLAGAALQELALVPHDDHLTAPVFVSLPSPGASLIALVSLSVEGRPYSARFELSAPPTSDPARQHQAQHGGQVALSGETHLEVSYPAPGEYRVFLSDTQRYPLAASEIEGAFLWVSPGETAEEKLPLQPSPAGDFWSAQGKPVIKSEIPLRVELSRKGAAVRAEFFLTAAVSPRGAVTGDHDHAAPHGGLVATAGEKHLELVISLDGHLDIFLLDDALQTLSAKDAQGSVRLELPEGVREFPLLYAPSADHLAAMVGALSVERVPVEVRLTIAGRPYQARFEYAF